MTDVAAALQNRAEVGEESEYLDASMRISAMGSCTDVRWGGSVAIMLTPVICPSCHHSGAIDGARLPRVLTCTRCGHRERFEAPPPKRLTRGQQAAERARRRAYETGELVRSMLST
jgi:hypothetical protein